MKCYLKKLSLDITNFEKEMYLEIPEKELGAINNLRCTGEEFDKRLYDRVMEENAPLDDKNTPRVTYIMYDEDYPVGEVMIRPVLNAYWYKMSGNIGYKIRPSERGKGYGNEILRLALEECKKMGLTSVRLCAFDFNNLSKKVIVKNGGRVSNKELFTIFYEIDLR